MNAPSIYMPARRLSMKWGIRRSRLSSLIAGVKTSMMPDAQTGLFEKPLRVGQDSNVGTGRDLSLRPHPE